MVSASAAIFFCFGGLSEITWTVDYIGEEFTTPEETPDEVAFWLGFAEGQEKRSSSYSLNFTKNDADELEVSGEEVFTLPITDPLAAELRHGGVASTGAGFEQALGCSLYTPGSGWIFAKAPRITVRDEQVIASFPVASTTVDLTDATSIDVQCSWDNDSSNTPPIGRRDFTFTAKGYSFTGISVLTPYVQEPHSIKIRTQDADPSFAIYVDPDGAGAALTTDLSEAEDSPRNELALFLAAGGLGSLLACAWFPLVHRVVAAAVAVISAAAGFVVGVSDSAFQDGGTPGAFLVDFSFAWWSLLLPALLIITVARRPDGQGGPAPSRLLRYGTAAPFAVMVLALVALAVRYAHPEAGQKLAGAGAAAVVSATIASSVLGRGWRVGAALGVLLFSGLGLAPLLEKPLPAGFMFELAAGCSLSWAAALTYCARRLGGWRVGALALTAFTAALCLFPVSRYLTWSGDDALFRAVTDYPARSVAYGLIELGALAVAAACVAVAFRRGADADAMRDNTVRLSGVALIGLSISPLIADASFMASDVISCVLGMITFWLLLPNAKADLAFRLSRLTPRAYVRLMHTEARSRLHRQAWIGFHKSAHSALSAEETGPREFEEKWRDFAERAVPVRSRDIFSTGPAMASSAARTPRRNALETAILGLVFAIPVVVIDLRSWEAHYSAVSLAQLAMLSLHILRWVVYGAFYGYFYPRLPGNVPVVKSTFFLWAVLLPELTLIPLSAPYATRDAIIVLLLRTGEVVVFCYGLGLSWEIRLARLAGLPWSGLRDLRRLSAVTAPAITVIVAMATTIATALAGAATVAMLQSGPASPEPPAVPQSPSPASPTATP